MWESDNKWEVWDLKRYDKGALSLNPASNNTQQRLHAFDAFADYIFINTEPEVTRRVLQDIYSDM